MTDALSAAVCSVLRTTGFIGFVAFDSDAPVGTTLAVRKLAAKLCCRRMPLIYLSGKLAVAADGRAALCDQNSRSSL